MPKQALSRLLRIVNGDSADDAGEPLTEATLTRLEKFAHFWVLVVGSFVRNRCPVRASALSYTTLLAIIPMLAVAMSVSSVFLKNTGEEQIKTFIDQFVGHMIPTSSGSTNLALGNDWVFVDEWVEESATNAVAAPISDTRVEVAQQKAASYIHQFIQNTYSGTLGVTGMIFLLFTAILMLTRIEETFNDIWGVTRGRNWISRIVLYWATITLVPLLLMAAFGMMSGPYLEQTRAVLNTSPYLATFLSQLLPVVVICFTFAMFYKLMPNTKVDFSAALVGGALAGTAWHFYNLLGFLLASRAVNASKIYGSLALIPLLMGGLYMVWLTVLFGAQVAYAYQNRAAYLQDRLSENVNQRGREFVALRLMTRISQRFHAGAKPPTVSEMSDELAIPSRLIQQVLRPLLAARLVTEVHRTAEPAYAPARPLVDITAHDILLAMRSTNGREVVTRDEPVRTELLGEFARIQEAERTAASAVSMLALVHRTQPQIAMPSAPAIAPAPIVVFQETPQAAQAETPRPEKTTVPAPAPVLEDVVENSAVMPPAPEPAPLAEPEMPKKSAPIPVMPEEQDFPL